MCILHNTISNRDPLDTKPAKTTHQSQNENRRHRIRNRKPRRPDTNRRRPHPPNRHRTTENHAARRRSPTRLSAATCRNMPRRHPEALGRKLVQPATRAGRRAQRTRKKGISLRQNSSGPRTSGPSQGQCSNAHRQTTKIPIRTKKTAALGDETTKEYVLPLVVSPFVLDFDLNVDRIRPTEATF